MHHADVHPGLFESTDSVVVLPLAAVAAAPLSDAGRANTRLRPLLPWEHNQESRLKGGEVWSGDWREVMILSWRELM